LQAVRAMLRSVTNSKDSCGDDSGCLKAVACAAECILQMVEGWLRFINQFAFVYVACYGDDFRTAGRRVAELFESSSLFNVVANDFLVGTVLLSCEVGVAVVAGLFGFGVAAAAGLGVASGVACAWFGFAAGLALAHVCLSAFDSACSTVLVCFVEDPGALEHHHPAYYAALTEALSAVSPDELTDHLHRSQQGKL
jgi:hypothetical protein